MKTVHEVVEPAEEFAEAVLTAVAIAEEFVAEVNAANVA